MNGLKTIIAGSRSVIDYSLLKLAIENIDWEISEVVSGGANGVDKLGERWAKDNSVDIKQFIPDWNGPHKKGAGFMRNIQMAKYAEAAVIIWDGISKGAQHMIKEANAHGLRVIVFLESELRKDNAANPIKHNPVFGKEAREAKGSQRNSQGTNHIKINGGYFVYYEDRKRNTPQENLCLDLYKEVCTLKERLDKLDKQEESGKT